MRQLFVPSSLQACLWVLLFSLARLTQSVSGINGLILWPILPTQWLAGACVDYGWDGGLTENEKFEGNINLEDYLVRYKDL
jgi:hypothetical protein